MLYYAILDIRSGEVVTSEGHTTNENCINAMVDCFSGTNIVIDGSVTKWGLPGFMHYTFVMKDHVLNCYRAICGISNTPGNARAIAVDSYLRSPLVDIKLPGFYISKHSVIGTDMIELPKTVESGIWIAKARVAEDDLHGEINVTTKYFATRDEMFTYFARNFSHGVVGIAKSQYEAKSNALDILKFSRLPDLNMIVDDSRHELHQLAIANEVKWVLAPAYGQQFINNEDCYEAWCKGRDFKIINGPYCSVRNKDDMLKGGGTILIFSKWNDADANHFVLIGQDWWQQYSMPVGPLTL